MNERIPVLFDRMLRPEWIDFALEQYIKCSDPAVHRRTLREYLAPQVQGEVSRQKIVRQLQRSVGHLSPLSEDRLRGLYDTMRTLAPEERGPLRVQILEEATPFFADCLGALRRLRATGTNGVEIKHLYDRLIEKYGDREMVYRRVRYVLQTLVLLGAVSHKGQKWFLTDHTSFSSSEEVSTS
jgi:hypothetical protein